MKIGPFSQYVRQAGTKKLFSLKMLDGTSITKLLLLNMIGRGWYKRDVSTENEVAIKESRQTQTQNSSFHLKF